jgi:hypothetical protein
MTEASRFVLIRGNWRRADDGWLRLPGDFVLNSFASAEEAQAECARREARCRAAIGNPFRCGPSLRYLTSFPDGVFHDWLLDAGLTIPAVVNDGQRNWVGWWDETSGCRGPRVVGVQR